MQARRDLVARDALWKLVVFDLHGDPLKPEHRKIWWSRGCVWKLLEIGNQELDEINVAREHYRQSPSRVHLGRRKAERAMYVLSFIRSLLVWAR